MRFLSLFSGIEAASAAWHPLGWTCVAVAEVEPFPCAVLKHHYPAVPNLGDINKITRQQIEALGHIDVIVLGFPCQDVSIAGLRKGFENADGTLTRSGLFHVAMRIIEWSKARWTCGENVPGLFSSHEGRDFASVVGELAGIEIDVPGDGWRTAGVALGPKGLVEWFVLDAQYTRVATHPRAVPQRRRRVFIIRDTGDWQGRPPFFLIRESLCGNPPPRRNARERPAPTLAARTRGGGGLGTDFDLDGGLTAVQCGEIVPQAMSSKWSKGSSGPAGDEVRDLVAQSVGTFQETGHGWWNDDPVAQSIRDASLGGGSHANVVTHSLTGEGFDASKCQIDGCGGKRHAMGFCKSHYERFKRHGDPLAGRVAEGEPMAFLDAHIHHPTDECVLWPYATLETGYGSVQHEGRTTRAHRLMCEKAHGKPVDPSMDAAHSCGAALCINPRHLRWATRIENMSDAIEHGTTTRGERHGLHKLTEGQVREIFGMLDDGETHESISKKYQVSRNAISDIASGKNWAWHSTGAALPLDTAITAFRSEMGGNDGGVYSDGTTPTCTSAPPAIAFRAAGQDGFTPSDVSPPIAATDGGGAGAPTIAFTCKDNGRVATAECSPTLRGMGHADSHANGGGQIAIAMQAGDTRLNPESGPDGIGIRQDGASFTLEARAEVQAVMTLAIRGRDGGADLEAREDGTANSILTPSGGRAGIGVGAICARMAVRRLTPTECLRLQGFPDNYLDITFRGKPACDGPKYRAIGNSMAVNCMVWIGQRIAELHEFHP